MTIFDRIEKLKQIEPFSSLRFSELALIAEVCLSREYQPGEKILPSGLVSDYLYIALEGKLADHNGMVLPQVVGVTSLLLNRPLEQSLEAGSSGAVCLLIKRGHFYTIVHECPALMPGFLRLLPQTSVLYRKHPAAAGKRTAVTVKEQTR